MLKGHMTCVVSKSQQMTNIQIIKPFSQLMEEITLNCYHYKF